jgi:hypothetical protein
MLFMFRIFLTWFFSAVILTRLTTHTSTSRCRARIMVVYYPSSCVAGVWEPDGHAVC